MKFFLDENFPKNAVALLAARGHQWMDIRGTDLEGADDDVIFTKAQEEGAVFPTTDPDFFHTVPLRVKNHHGVVVVALRQPNRQRILSRLAWFLDYFENTTFKNKTLELRDRTYVMYPNPEEHLESG